jgi:DNA repair protein RadC
MSTGVYHPLGQKGRKKGIDGHRGTVNNSVLRVAEIFRPAITSNCPGIVICHNHPSGDPTPSRDDIEVTQQLVKAGRLLEIELLDHIIIGAGRFVSLRERLAWVQLDSCET